MKNTIFLMFLSFFSLSMTAQDMDRKERREKIKELKIAFITDRLELSSAEAQKFWPVYNEFESKYNELRKQAYTSRKNNDAASLSETQAKALLEEMISIEEQKNSLKSKFVSDLSNILPAKKIILLKQAEYDFDRKMIEEFKRRRQNKNDRP